VIQKLSQNVKIVANAVFSKKQFLLLLSALFKRLSSHSGTAIGVDPLGGRESSPPIILLGRGAKE